MKKINLYFLGSISMIGIVALDAPTLCETVQLAAVSSERVETTSATISAAPTEKINSIALPDVILANSTPIAGMNPVTSVSQLSDVQPSDWAFQALQSLIERYGIAGYQDSTFRGNRAMNRYEFAAGLNAAIQRMNESIAAGLTTQTSRDDVVTVQRLQQEFASELATTRSRVDILEARAAELEANQFSITTKLTGQVIFAANAGGFGGDRIIDPTGVEITNNQPNPTFSYRAALDLDTSFFGTDLLKLRLDALGSRGNDNAAGFLEPNFGSTLEFTLRGTPNPGFGLSRLSYTFTPFKDTSISLGPAIVTTDYIDINSYASGIVDFETLALVNNYLLFPINGPSAGAVLQWNPGQGPFKVRALYAAADAANPSSNSQFVGNVFPFATLLYPDGGGDRGLFGLYQGTVELEYSPSQTFALRLEYSGGNVFNSHFDAFGANLEVALSEKFAIFGRYGYGSYGDTAFGDINPNYWMAGVAFRNLLVPGALAGIAAGQPFIESAVGNATQTNIEAFYNFPLSDNIRITPLIQVVTHPANQDANGTIVTGTLKTVFSF